MKFCFGLIVLSKSNQFNMDTTITQFHLLKYTKFGLSLIIFKINIFPYYFFLFIKQTTVFFSLYLAIHNAITDSCVHHCSYPIRPPSCAVHTEKMCSCYLRLWEQKPQYIKMTCKNSVFAFAQSLLLLKRVKVVNRHEVRFRWFVQG